MTQLGHKILLVEDNPGDVLLIEESLREAAIPYQLTLCETVEAALRKVCGYTIDDPNVPDVLLLDYNLPGGDAREVLRASRATPALSGTRKAVISSSLSPRDKDDALRSGAECFVYKPADLDQFLDEVRTAMVKLLSHLHACDDAGNSSSEFEQTSACTDL